MKPDNVRLRQGKDGGLEHYKHPPSDIKTAVKPASTGIRINGGQRYAGDAGNFGNFRHGDRQGH